MTAGFDLYLIALVLGAASLLVSLLVLRTVLRQDLKNHSVITAAPNRPTPAASFANLADDRELAAVITAAIQAYQQDSSAWGSSSPAGFVVRRIRRV